MYNLTIRTCTSPPHLAPRLKIFKLKFTIPPGIEPETWWIRGKHANIWASAASFKTKYCKGNCIYLGLDPYGLFPCMWPKHYHCHNVHAYLDNIANGVMSRLLFIIAIVIPGVSLWITLLVASGVTSWGLNPVPPVVRITSTFSLSDHSWRTF